jgi:G:T/U-mismatch repair DNA glycosylase
MDMSTMTNLNIRVDAETKQKAEELFNDIGFTMSAAINVFLKQAIAHNGGESFRHARHSELPGLPVYKLPSTSPANASWSFERKLAAWAEVLQRHA